MDFAGLLVARCTANHGNGGGKMYERTKPTKAQLDFLQWLIQETRTDPKWFDGLERLTRRQAQDLIDKLSVGVDVKKWEG